MEKYINEYGKECYRYVSEDDLFDSDLFHEVQDTYSDDLSWALHTNLGSITVLDRMTGFGWRDVETGFRDQLGNFWLASGRFDIRDFECKTIGCAISLIKENANTCIPGRCNTLIKPFTDARGGVR